MGSRLGRGANPGRYFDRADIEAATATTDAGGGVTETWAPITGGADVPVEVIDLDGRELIRAMQTQTNLSAEVHTSVYVSGVTASQRVVITTQAGRVLYLVAAPITEGRKRRLVLMCREADT